MTLTGKKFFFEHVVLELGTKLSQGGYLGRFWVSVCAAVADKVAYWLECWTSDRGLGSCPRWVIIIHVLFLGKTLYFHNLPLSTLEYKWVLGNSQGNLMKY